jgi:hypothetical protein
MQRRRIAGFASAALCLAFTALGSIGAHAQTADEPVYGRVESFDSHAQRIVVDGRSYAMPTAALVEWQGGRAADRAAVEPRMRVSLSLVAATTDDDVPQVRTLTLHMD